MSEGQVDPVTQAFSPAPFASRSVRPSAVKAFEVHPLLQNPHTMTVLAAFWPRGLSRLSPATERLIEVEPGTCLLAKCHWQKVPRQHPSMVLVHGLAGSSESYRVLGTAEKAFTAGFNVLRINQRNCGGTEHLTPTLCDAGLSQDYRAVLKELIERDALPEVFFVGYSIGGNLVLKMAGELGEDSPGELQGICAVSPCLDLTSSSAGSGDPRNLLYEWYCLHSMKSAMQKKAKLFPERYCIDRVSRMRTLHQWHETITAPACGYRNAADYYYRASALRVVGQIQVPTLILTAQDDPFVPIASFRNEGIVSNPSITLVTPEHGGHCAFISCNGGERFWAEARVVEFCIRQSNIAMEIPTESRRA
jgi:predicted alpha/beta-fold hydrolase